MRKNLQLYLLSIVTGFIAGAIVSLFRFLLLKSANIRAIMFDHSQPWYYHLLILMGMFALALIINYLKDHIPLIAGSGIPQSKAVIFGRYSFLEPVKQMVSKFIGSLSAIGMGLSLGREGPSVQFGTLSATIIGNRFKLTPTQKKYLNISGAGAGLAAAFNAPIASVVFLIEDTLGWVSLRMIIPGLLGCICAGFVANTVFSYNIYESVEIIRPDLPYTSLLLILSGFAFLGMLGGKLFNSSLFGIMQFSTTTKIPVWVRILSVVILTYIIGMSWQDLTAGGESELTYQALHTSGNTWIIFSMLLVKIFFTCICYSLGLCGSLLLPLIVCGGLMGKAYCLLLVSMNITNIDSSGYFTIIGMAIMFVSVVRAPISAIMLILEMTGQYQVFFPTVVTATLTFILGQFINIPPVYDKLYQIMFVRHKGNNVISMEVSQGSYYSGKTIQEIRLPENCYIKEIKKDETTTIGIPDDYRLSEGDILQIQVPAEEYAQLYKSFRALCNE